MEDVDKAAFCGYLAAMYDFWGKVVSHEYAERDGRWYLDVTIVEPPGFRLPLPFIRKEFGGKIFRDGECSIWQAVGPRAYEVLSAIQPYLLSPIEEIDEALDAFEIANGYEDELPND